MLFRSTSMHICNFNLRRVLHFVSCSKISLGLLVVLVLLVFPMFLPGITSLLTCTKPFIILNKNTRPKYSCKKLSGINLLACFKPILVVSLAVVWKV